MRQHIIQVLLLLSGFQLFGQADSAFITADHYKTSTLDVAIFPESYIDILPGVRFTPSRQEIDSAEMILAQQLKTINAQLPNQSSGPVIHKKLHKYKRQYFGYIDANGDRILLINCFWAKHDHEDWLVRKIVMLDGGSYFWHIKCNLNKNELFELSVNGNS